MKKTVIVGVALASVIAVSTGSYAYAKEVQHQNAVKTYKVALNGVNALYSDKNKTMPKTNLNKDWEKRVTSLVNKVQNSSQRHALLKQINNVSKMLNANASVNALIKNGVLVTPKTSKINEANVFKVHDQQLSNATKQVAGIKGISKKLYALLEKRINQGKVQIAQIKNLYSQLNSKKVTSTKELNAVDSQIKKVPNKVDEAILLKKANEVQKGMGKKVIASKPSQSSKSEPSSVKKTTTPSHSASPSSTAKQSSSSSSTPSKNVTAAKPTSTPSSTSGSSSSTKQPSSNTSNQSASKQNPNNVSKGEANSIVGVINGGQATKTGSGNMANGQNTWDGYTFHH